MLVDSIRIVENIHYCRLGTFGLVFDNYPSAVFNLQEAFVTICQVKRHPATSDDGEDGVCHIQCTTSSTGYCSYYLITVISGLYFRLR